MPNVGRPVRAIDLLSYKEYYFDSVTKASRELGASRGSVHSVLNGQYKSAHGYYFWYADTPLTIDVDEHRFNVHGRDIKATRVVTGETYIFHSCAEASRKLGIHISNVSRALRGDQPPLTRGYEFEYVEEK